MCEYNMKNTVCRVCGCSQNHACPGGCFWVEPDLCSQCAPQERGYGIGYGKVVSMKEYLEDAKKQGVKIIAIDPEAEYDGLSESMREDDSTAPEVYICSILERSNEK